VRSVLITGNVSSQQASCTNATGQSTLTLTIQGLPASFSTASLACKFLPWTTLQGFAHDVQQVSSAVTNTLHLALFDLSACGCAFKRLIRCFHDFRATC
jgi:hypothetical protein